LYSLLGAIRQETMLRLPRRRLLFYHVPNTPLAADGPQHQLHARVPNDQEDQAAAEAVQTTAGRLPRNARPQQQQRQWGMMCTSNKRTCFLFYIRHRVRARARRGNHKSRILLARVTSLLNRLLVAKGVSILNRLLVG
jgi:hypothetical protein